MTEQQIRKFFAELVKHQGEFKDWSINDGRWVIEHPKEAVALFKAAVVDRNPEEEVIQPLLKFLNTTTIQPAGNKFVVADHFNKDNADGVTISLIGGTFRSLCGPVIEESIEQAIVLRSYQLLCNEADHQIIAELGGQSAAETFFRGIWELLKLQKHGEKGKLLTNGHVNIFYVSVNGVLLAVGVDWLGAGWLVYAYSVMRPNMWLEGYLVFSGNSGSLST